MRWVFGGGGLVRAIWPPLAFVCPRAGGWGRSLTRILLPLGRNVRHATNRSPVIGSFSCSSPPPPGLRLRGAGERLSENSCGHFSLLVLDLDMIPFCYWRAATRSRHILSVTAIVAYTPCPAVLSQPIREAMADFL